MSKWLDEYPAMKELQYRGNYEVNGRRVPGATTILGSCNQCDPLIHWSARVTKEAALRYIGETPNEQHTIEGASKFINENGKDAIVQKACDIGSIAHLMVECRLTGQKFDKSAYPEDLMQGALQAYRAFKAWAEQRKDFGDVGAEVRLVCRTYYFGGTVDLVETNNGVLTIRDWKTSKRIWDHYGLQVAAYRFMVQECFPELEVSKAADVVRFDKRTGDFDHRHISATDDQWDHFLVKRLNYEMNKKPDNRIYEVIDNICKHFGKKVA